MEEAHKVPSNRRVQKKWENVGGGEYDNTHRRKSTSHERQTIDVKAGIIMEPTTIKKQSFKYTSMTGRED